MMKIRRSTPEVVRDIALRMRDSDLREFLALLSVDNREDLAELMANTHGTSCYIAYLDETPVAAGAMVSPRPNVVQLMFFATDDFPKIAVSLTSFVAKRLFPAYCAKGFHRIEAVSIADYEQTHRWLESSLGLGREAVLRQIGKGREDFIMFAWVAPK